MEQAGAVWLGAVAWTVMSSFALALRRSLHRRDRSAFDRYRLPDNGDVLDWSTKSGAWFDLAVAEEHERLMRGD